MSEDYRCPKGHMVAAIVPVSCEACGCAVAYEPASKGMALARQQRETRARLKGWADSLEFYTGTEDGSPEMVRAVAVEMRAHAG